MIRQRGTFPRTLWQKGALQSTKKTRWEVSVGKKSIARGSKTRQPHDQQSQQNFNSNTNRQGTMSELNRLTHGSFANLGAQRHHKRSIRNQKT